MSTRRLTKAHGSAVSHNASVDLGISRGVGSASLPPGTSQRATQPRTGAGVRKDQAKTCKQVRQGSNSPGVVGDRGEPSPSLTPQYRPESGQQESSEACSSARELARALSKQMAEGTITSLPRFDDDADPRNVQLHLLAFYRLLDLVHEEHRRPRAPTREDRIALASIAAQVNVAIFYARAWLSRVAKRGGRGVPAGSVS